MSRAKACKITQLDAYPCPCRRSGELLPIALTEALGCSRCHHMFVVRPDGYTLEQVSSAEPHRPLWYWTGDMWMMAYTPTKERGCLWLVAVVFCLLLPLLFCLPIAFNGPLAENVLLWVLIIAGCLLVVLTSLIWLVTARRR